MKKLLAVFALLVFVGCSTPTDTKTTTVVETTKTTHVAIVMNSLWKEVSRTTFSANTSARSATTEQTMAEKQAIIDAYNAQSLTDQEWLYLDEAPDIANAPNGNVYWVNQYNIPVEWAMNVTRQHIADNYASFVNAFPGQTLYVDHIPPTPVLAKDSTPFEYYSLYVIEDEPTPNVVLYEDHAGYTADEVFHGQWILLPMGQFMPDGTPGGGWPSLDNYYYQNMTIYQNTLARPQDNWPGVTKVHLVTRQVYIPNQITLPPVTP